MAAIRTAQSQVQCPLGKFTRAVILSDSRAALLAVVSDNNPITQDALDCHQDLKILSSLGKTKGLGLNPGEGMDVCKCIVPLRHGGTLNSRRAASPLIRWEKKSPGRLHTWKNDRKVGKRSKPQVQLLERLVVAVRGRQLQGMTDISSCRRKKADGSQQASLLSNSLQQRGDKCHGLLWPDAFIKGGGPYSPAVLNAASR
ncbi:hypothetical protein TNCV_5013571 [Trichonephila clavipes]|nr:hypothetical protein TNCV_5013571 [Trichonephila clavipes]